MPEGQGADFQDWDGASGHDQTGHCLGMHTTMFNVWCWTAEHCSITTMHGAGTRQFCRTMARPKPIARRQERSYGWPSKGKTHEHPGAPDSPGGCMTPRCDAGNRRQGPQRAQRGGHNVPSCTDFVLHDAKPYARYRNAGCPGSVRVGLLVLLIR